MTNIFFFEILGWKVLFSQNFFYSSQKRSLRVNWHKVHYAVMLCKISRFHSNWPLIILAFSIVDWFASIFQRRKVRVLIMLMIRLCLFTAPRYLSVCALRRSYKTLSRISTRDGVQILFICTATCNIFNKYYPLKYRIV